MALISDNATERGTKEWRDKISASLRDRKRSLAECTAISKGKTGVKTGPQSEQARRNMSRAAQNSERVHRANRANNLIRWARALDRPRGRKKSWLPKYRRYVVGMMKCGLTQREVIKKLAISDGLAKDLFRSRHAKEAWSRVQLPPCACGKRAGHKGWCDERLRRSPERQHYIRFILPERNRLITQRGVPKTATHRARISDARVGIPTTGDAEIIEHIKALPVRQRRAISRTRKQIANPSVRLDRTLDGDTAIHEILRDLMHPEPSPLEALMAKEEYEMERKYHQWERSHRPRPATAILQPG